jgi:hypothetical protein
MGHTKVRCQFCGAKNGDGTTERCRICGGLLPDFAERRKKTAEGESFKTLVESEVETWRDYTDGKFDAGGRSRRPSELPPVHAQTLVPGQDITVSTPQPVSLADPLSGPEFETNGHGNGNGNGNGNGDGSKKGLRRLFRSGD